MRVGKEFVFHAAHSDVTAPEGDQCGRLHGHSYKVKIEAESITRNERGMVLHGDELKRFYREVVEPKVEHRFLNETLDFNPTMEAVCAWIASSFKGWLDGSQQHSSYKVRVTLWETPTMYAETTL